jgi:hypothetical protein
MYFDRKSELFGRKTKMKLKWIETRSKVNTSDAKIKMSKLVAKSGRAERDDFERGFVEFVLCNGKAMFCNYVWVPWCRYFEYHAEAEIMINLKLKKNKQTTNQDEDNINTQYSIIIFFF